MRKHHSSKCVSLPIYAVYVRRDAECWHIGNVINSRPEEAILYYVMQLVGSSEFKNFSIKDVYYRCIGRRRIRRECQEDILSYDVEEDIVFKRLIDFEHGDK